MHAQIVSKQEFYLTCYSLVAAYFNQFPDPAFQDLVSRSLKTLRSRQTDLRGEPGGWAGGLVHAIATWMRPPGRCVLNAEMEEIFGVSFGTVRRRADQVWNLIEADVIAMMTGAV